MLTIKKGLQGLFDYLLIILFGLLLPFIILSSWVKALFSNDVNDSEKVGMTKEIVIVILFGLVLGSSYLLLDEISNFFNRLDYSSGVSDWLSSHWYLFIVVFLIFGLLEHFKITKTKD